MFDKFWEYPEKSHTPEKFSTPPRKKESKLLLCKCATTRKDYFTRLDRKRGERSWKFAYAFPFHESLRGDSSIVSKREVIEIKGKTDDWNGCPYCMGKNLAFCNCGTIFCIEVKFDGEYSTCPGCNRLLPVYRSNTFDTRTSSY